MKLELYILDTFNHILLWQWDLPHNLSILLLRVKTIVHTGVKTTRHITIRPSQQPARASSHPSHFDYGI